MEFCVNKIGIEMDITLEKKLMKCEADFHRALCEQLDFGPYYGNNLAALRDRLANDIERPVRLVWLDSELSRNAMDDDLNNRILEILRFVEKQDKSYCWEERFTFVHS